MKLCVGCAFNSEERAFYATEGAILNENTTKEISAAVNIKCTTLLMSSIINVI
jgi:hypothetical protein